MGSQAILVFPHQALWRYSDGDPPNGASNAGGVGTNRDSGRIAGCLSMTAAVRDQQLTVVGAVVYNSYGARLITAQIATRQWIYAEEKRTLSRSGKSEAEVTNNRRLRSTYCTIEANTKHRAASLRQ